MHPLLIIFFISGKEWSTMKIPIVDIIMRV